MGVGFQLFPVLQLSVLTSTQACSRLLPLLRLEHFDTRSYVILSVIDLSSV